MAEDLARRLARLQLALEQGALDEDTYNASVAALTSQVGTPVTVQGSGGAAAQGGVAAGAGGVAVGGDVHGNIYVGKPTDDPVEAIAVYRRVYVAGCENLPLRGVDVGASDAQGNRRQMALEQVYVVLDTKTRVQKEAEGGSQEGPPGARRARRDPRRHRVGSRHREPAARPAGRSRLRQVHLSSTTWGCAWRCTPNSPTPAGWIASQAGRPPSAT